MRRFLPASSAAILALMLLSGCSSHDPNVATPGTGIAEIRSASLADIARIGAIPASASLPRLDLSGPTSIQPETYPGRRDLYVANYGFGTVVLLKNQGYVSDGSITSGLNGPIDDFLDRGGNLYVANITGDNITEYAPGGSSPSFTYNSGMLAPVAVAVDRLGNVYEADYGSQGNSGVVNEYAQNSNTVLQTCPSPGSPEGVAVDAAGDVFVSYNIHSEGGRIAEYKGGLQGCSATVFNKHVFFAGGIALDKSNDIIVTDQVAQEVDVIGPPYSKIKRRLGARYFDPFHVSINKANTKVFVADFQSSVVFVVDYASGKIVEKLGYREGLGVPGGAVDGQNAVY